MQEFGRVVSGWVGSWAVWLGRDASIGLGGVRFGGVWSGKVRSCLVVCGEVG